MALRADDVDLGRDRDLVARYQAGDPQAFDDLYRRYFDRLTRFCARLTSDPHEAEEVAQEAFVRAYRSMDSLQGERRFYPWVTVIARRIVIDRHRKTARVELTDEVDLGSVEPDLAHIFDAVDHAHLRTAMDRLGPRHRDVLVLREGQRLSYADIATELDVPVTTVEALLHRARKALRREYARAGGTNDGLYGLPLLGWLATRVAGLRDRGSERWVEVASVAAPAAVAALAAVAVVVPGAGADDPAQLAAPAAAPTTVVVDEPVDIPAASTDFELPVAGLPVAPAPSTTAAPAPPAASVGPVDVFIGPDGTDDAAEEARDLPTNGDVGPATFGADIVQAVEDSVDFLLGTTEDPSQAPAEPSDDPDSTNRLLPIGPDA